MRSSIFAAFIFNFQLFSTQLSTFNSQLSTFNSQLSTLNSQLFSYVRYQSSAGRFPDIVA